MHFESKYNIAQDGRAAYFEFRLNQMHSHEKTNGTESVGANISFKYSNT